MFKSDGASKMPKVKIHLKDHSGREFGGDFQAGHISSRKEEFTVDLEYSGTKSSKRLGVAAIILDRAVIEQLYLLSHARPWPDRASRS
jgi:hypothetical protein